MKIGIPRALLYYWYGFLWEDFWRSAGFEVLTSPPTNIQITSIGTETGLDELCLPVKNFLGHLSILAPKVDRVMIPHLIKVESDAFICPKFMGLPDIVSHALPNIKEKLMIVKVGPNQINMLASLQQALSKLGFKALPQKRLSQLRDPGIENPSLHELNKYRMLEDFSQKPFHFTIGLFGHPYCLYDSGFNRNLLSFLTRHQIRILAPEMLPLDYAGVGSGKLAKKIFWTTGRLQFDALEWMLNDPKNKVDGFIQVTPFACGPEAIVGDMIERRVKQANRPYLRVYFEEHSGEAGIITRLEAFIDLIQYHHLVC